MKIRIRGNSIRYRLDKKDIDVLNEHGKVEEHTWIGAHNLHFCIRSRGNIVQPAIKLEGSGVHLSVPSPVIEKWAGTEEVGFDFDILNPDGSALKILVEKDFKCLTVRDEDDSAAFENPNAGKTC
ncbi:DUF7009 family protein [Chitinophaga cymbidii]|uniref:Uncharacterized protein n=1 Tax=Chitinophaga cymbidii TaxID=1096750 RepID=A0A512REE5_9BACT|nr:hypothetical protein [Chitinophaga cymbidii]GEP94075.1 hypothetical protein CCY01nite_03350 [Chitinophaga cymbidii]